MFTHVNKFIFSAIVLTQLGLFAAPITCYQIAQPDRPDATSVLSPIHSEVWCYQKLNSPSADLYVFNADEEKVKPELAFVIDKDGVMTHGSLLAGKTTIHKLLVSDFNPFSVPLTEPTYLESLSSQDFRILFEGRALLNNSAEEVLKILTAPSDEPIENFALQTGKQSASAEITPWRGFWWPYNNRPLSRTTMSPLAKYDRFVKARTGSNPGAQAWENRYHRYHGINWEGHCNGWAASSVLRKEPTEPKSDSQSGVVFTVSDQKGILAETDYCAKVAFFGSRYRGRVTDNIYDINAGTFHKTLKYYIGSLGKPVATDYKNAEPVDNHVISGYTMNVVKTGANTYSVVTTIRIHRYDNAASNNTGDAPPYTRTYRYNLVENSDGSLRGSWRSTNPDFLWVPLSSTKCGNNNQRISETYVSEILAL